MKASIITVGTELLFGQVVNTNAAFLSRRLNDMGFDVLYHFSVGDNPGRLEYTLKRAFENTELILLTGGLGPTQDDLTKEVVAKVFGAELSLNKSSLSQIKKYYRDRSRKMSPNNIKQAYMPAGAVVFHNESGTAPAFAIEDDGRCAICFPGPPRELEWVFEHHAALFLKKFIRKHMVYKIIRTSGMGESDVETALMSLIDGQTDPTIATYAKDGECMIRVASQRDNAREAENAVSDTVKKIDALIGEHIYSYDDEELAEVIVKKLIKENLKLSSAESCTGGLFASEITAVPGASEVFSHGIVAYTPEAKNELLGVRTEIIERHSVVSAEVAEAMALGVFENARADLAISITGFAGPTADTGREPGEAYIGYVYAVDDKDLKNTDDCVRDKYIPDNSSSKRNFIKGYIFINTKKNMRNWNRKYFCLNMMMIINSILDGKLKNNSADNVR